MAIVRREWHRTNEVNGPRRRVAKGSVAKAAPAARGLEETGGLGGARGTGEPSPAIGDPGEPAPAVRDPRGGRNRGASASNSFVVVLV